MGEREAKATSQVDATGVPNLDAVLGGGLPRGALAIVVGPPGSGKTTLACQIAFAAATIGRRALILTALSEPTSKLVSHLRHFRFFDDTLLGDMVQVVSLEQFLQRGLEATGEELLALAHAVDAGIVMIDGFRGMRGADTDPQTAREFLYDVGSSLSLRGTTTIITSEADPQDPTFFPELTTADVIVGMHYRLTGVYSLRAIEAVKVRGGAPLPGLHGLVISEDGVTIYPRLEARIATMARHGDAGTAEQGQDWKRVPEGIAEIDEKPAIFDVPGLDAVLNGGLVRTTVTLVTGSLGTGKSTLGLRFALTGAAHDEPALFLGFRETPAQLQIKARIFGAEATLERAIAPGGGMELLYLPPVEINPDIVADLVLATLERIGARRLVVDSIAELERAVLRAGEPARVEEYMAALAVVLRRRNITSLFIKETPHVLAQTLDLTLDPIGMVADNVLLLQQLPTNNQLRRVLSVLKTRFSPHDTALHEYVIGPPEGIRVANPSTPIESLSRYATVPPPESNV